MRKTYTNIYRNVILLHAGVPVKRRLCPGVKRMTILGRNGRSPGPLSSLYFLASLKSCAFTFKVFTTPAPELLRTPARVPPATPKQPPRR